MTERQPQARERLTSSTWKRHFVRLGTLVELSTEEFERRLDEMVREPGDHRLGFVGPGSVSWTVDGELVLHAAGPRALLMQLAHPMVAQGVADHSHFRTDPFGRTIRTFDSVYRLVFGTREQAIEVARRIHMVHKRVRGTLPHSTGAHLAGTEYAANDPSLLVWVWATLIDSARYAFETFIRPLSDVERETWYQECRYLSGLFGLPLAAFPPTYPRFAVWMERMIAGNEIGVSQTAREIVSVFLRPHGGLRPLGPVFHVLAAGTLPPRLREDFGLRWDFEARAVFRIIKATIHAGARATPRPLRSMPSRIRAQWRCRGVIPAPRPMREALP
jgi:uncharacterized protein (DUF2236 family)